VGPSQVIKQLRKVLGCGSQLYRREGVWQQLDMYTVNTYVINIEENFGITRNERADRKVKCLTCYLKDNEKREYRDTYREQNADKSQFIGRYQNKNKQCSL